MRREDWVDIENSAALAALSCGPYMIYDTVYQRITNSVGPNIVPVFSSIGIERKKYGKNID